MPFLYCIYVYCVEESVSRGSPIRFDAEKRDQLNQNEKWGNNENSYSQAEGPSARGIPDGPGGCDGLDGLVSRLGQMERPAPKGLVPFQRDFYFEHKEIERMSWDQVAVLRKEDNICIIAPTGGFKFLFV